MLPKGGSKVSLAKKKDAATMSSTVHVGNLRPKHDADHIIHKIVGGEPAIIHNSNKTLMQFVDTAWEH